MIGVADSASALALLRQGGRFAMILADLHLPSGASGSELLAEIAVIDGEQAGRVVFHTGGPSSPEEVAFLSTQRVLLKPASIAAINAMIANVVFDAAA